MKWFIRLVLLLVVFLPGESGLYAGSLKDYSQEPSHKHNGNLIDGDIKESHTQQLDCSFPLQLKKEYRKIKGTKDDDDDKKSYRQKKIKGLESNAGKYTLSKAYTASLSHSAIDQYCFISKKASASLYHFLCAKSYRLYNLFQVFRI